MSKGKAYGYSRSPRALLSIAAIFLAPAVLHSADSADIRIVFESNISGNSEVYVINADGNGLINLTNKPASDGSPQWSPDGSQVVFRSNRDGNNEIYVMNANGSGQTNLTNNAGSDLNPHWSPDGARIAFISSRDGGESEIYTMNADGSRQTRLTNNSTADTDPRWSPDGSKIAFRSIVSGDDELFVMNANGSGLLNLTNTPTFDDSNPQWSPDGSRLLFHTNRDGNFEVYVVNANGSGAANLTNNPDVDAAASWSPDGTKILLQARHGGSTDIHVMNSDGSGLINLTNNPALEQNSPVWSRGGSRILFKTNTNMFAMDANGGNLINVTNNAGSYFSYSAFEEFVFVADGGVILANLAPKVSSISPLSIISVFGLNFTDESILFPNLDGQGRISTTLGGVCFEIGGERAPIFAVTPTQANLQKPATKNLGPVSVVAIRNCNTTEEVRSEVELVTVAEATPAFFLFPPLVNGGLIAARFNIDDVAVAPNGMFKDQFGTSRPAAKGDIITLYGTGWGDTGAALATGQLATGAAELLETANVMVTFGGVALAPEDVLYVGVTPGTAGLYQLVIRVPQSATNGNKKVVLRVYGKSTPDGPVIPVGSPQIIAAK